MMKKLLRKIADIAWEVSSITFAVSLALSILALAIFLLSQALCTACS